MTECTDPSSMMEGLYNMLYYYAGLEINIKKLTSQLWRGHL